MLTDAEIERFKKIFHDADESGDMLLDEGELQALMVLSGFMWQQREFVYEAMRTMDTSGDGAIDFGEFLEFMVKIKETKAARAGFLGLGGLGEPAAPPLPKVMEPGYFKVARYVPSVAPVFERRWVEMRPDGRLMVAETRGAVGSPLLLPFSYMKTNYHYHHHLLLLRAPASSLPSPPRPHFPRLNFFLWSHHGGLVRR